MGIDHPSHQNFGFGLTRNKINILTMPFLGLLANTPCERLK